jgi:hypothetical protein
MNLFARGYIPLRQFHGTVDNEPFVGILYVEAKKHWRAERHPANEPEKTDMYTWRTWDEARTEKNDDEMDAVRCTVCSWDSIKPEDIQMDIESILSSDLRRRAWNAPIDDDEIRKEYGL